MTLPPWSRLPATGERVSGRARRGAVRSERTRWWTGGGETLAGVVGRAQPPEGAQLLSPSDQLAGVVPFEEVWSRSFCRARETLVDVLSEFPHEAEHIFKPPCVRLWRCAGCCGDESLECAPIETRTVDLQVVQVSPVLGTTQQVKRTFTEHTRCVCRPRRKRLKNDRHQRISIKRRPREPGSTASTPLCRLPHVERPGALSQILEKVLDPATGKGLSS